MQLPPIIFSTLLLSLVTFQKAFLYTERRLRSISSRPYPQISGKKIIFQNFAIQVLSSEGFFYWWVFWGLVCEFFSLSLLVCLFFVLWEKKPKATQTKPECEYSVAASLKISIESGCKIHQFRIMILMNDTITTIETQISFCQLSVEGNYIFLQKGMFCDKIEEVKTNLNKIIILMASVVGAW